MLTINYYFPKASMFTVFCMLFFVNSAVAGDIEQLGCNCDVKIYLELTTKKCIVHYGKYYTVIEHKINFNDSALYKDNLCLYVVSNIDTYLIFYTNERLFEFGITISKNGDFALRFYPFTNEYYIGFVYPEVEFSVYSNSLKVEYYFNEDTFYISYISYRWVWSDLVNKMCKSHNKEPCYLSLLLKYDRSIDSLLNVIRSKNMDYDSLWNVLTFSVRMWTEYISIWLAYSENDSYDRYYVVRNITHKIDSLFNIAVKMNRLENNGNFWWMYESFKGVAVVLYSILQVQSKKTSISCKLKDINNAFVQVCKMGL